MLPIPSFEKIYFIAMSETMRRRRYARDTGSDDGYPGPWKTLFRLGRVGGEQMDEEELGELVVPIDGRMYQRHSDKKLLDLI